MLSTSRAEDNHLNVTCFQALSVKYNFQIPSFVVIQKSNSGRKKAANFALP